MFSPLFRSSIVVAVLVLSCGTAAASEEAEMESFLRKPRVDVGTSRILDSSCPPGEELFYNAYFTLCDEDGGATEKCDNPEDEEEMGRAIRNIVSNVDRDFPAWQDSSLSSINTTVCIFPSFSMEGVELEDIDERRELTQKKRRKKKSYTYTSGGRCRRCKATDRLLLRAITSNSGGRTLKDIDVESMAKQTCDLASMSSFAMSIGQKGLDSIVQYLDNIATRAAELRDPSGAMKKAEIVEKSATKVIKLLEEATEEDDDAQLACLQAMDYANDGNGEENEKLIEKCFKTSDSASGKVKKLVDKIHMEHETAKEDTRVTLEVIVDQKHKELRETHKEEAGEKKDSLKMKDEDEELKKLKNKLKDDDLKQEEAAEIRAEILQRERQYEEEIKKGKEELNVWEEEIKEEEAHLKALDEYRVAMEFAGTLEDWMNEYKTVLEQVIKYDLFKGDNKVTCLYQRYKDKFSVVVDMVPVANEGGTNIEQCGAQSDNKLQWEP